MCFNFFDVLVLARMWQAGDIGNLIEDGDYTTVLKEFLVCGAANHGTTERAHSFALEKSRPIVEGLPMSLLSLFMDLFIKICEDNLLLSEYLSREICAD